MKKLAPLLIAFVLISLSCTKGFGNKLHSEKLDIYYPNKQDEQLADKLGKFWHEKGLTASKKQSIQLVELKNYFQVKIIPTEKFTRTNFSIEEHQLLLELQKEMNSTIFIDKPCHIVICDTEFNEVYDINS